MIKWTKSDVIKSFVDALNPPEQAMVTDGKPALTDIMAQMMQSQQQVQ